jgi:hypothetical protein
MRRISWIALVALVLALTAMSASAQTLVTDGYYRGGEDEDTTQVNVEDGFIVFIQSCFAGATTEEVVVDQYGDFNAAGEFGDRPHIGSGYVNEVDVHFVGTESGGLLDISVIQDSNSALLAQVVVELDALVSLDPCGR